MNRAPNTIWSLRGVGSKIFVLTTDDDKIEIVFGGGYAERAIISRKDAKLLAKRINQCLEATVKK